MSSKVTCTCGHSWSKASSSKKDMNVCHICGKDNTMKDGGWLSKYNDGGPVQENYNDASATEGPDYVGAGYDIIGRNYSPAWGGQFEHGGTLPGSVGFTYARTKGIPSNGPYAKKTKASAQDGTVQKPVDLNKPIALNEVVVTPVSKRVEAQRDIIQKTKPKQNYSIVDKKNNIIHYYNPSGELISKENVITGASNVDSENALSMREYFENKDTDSHEDYFKYLKDTESQTTPAGIFNITSLRENTAKNPDKLGSLFNKVFRPQREEDIENIRLQDYGEQQKLFTLASEYGVPSSKAIHGTLRDNRVKALADNNADRNLSNGCINVNGETVCFDTLGKGSSVYVLPEENDELLHPDQKRKSGRGTNKVYTNTKSTITDALYSRGIKASKDAIDFISSVAEKETKGGRSKSSKLQTLAPYAIAGSQGMFEINPDPEAFGKYLPKDFDNSIGAGAEAVYNFYKSFDNLDPVKKYQEYTGGKDGRYDKAFKKIYDKMSKVYEDGGVIAQNGKEVSYDQWKKKYKLNETPDYNLKRAWELGYNPDETGHLPTVDNQTGQFLKAKGHPTIKLELDWYNSPEGAEFKSKNTLDSTGKFFKYVPKLQNGKEMQFYQNGLDWKPKSISRDGSVIEDDRGQWDHPGEITKINSNEITMQGVDYPVLGISDTGDTQMMQPGEDYTYDGKSVTEYPMMKDGGKSKPIYVTDKNDPRYKAYQDSLSLHNESVNDLNLLKKMKSSGKAIDFLESRFETGEPRKNNEYPLSKKGEKSFNSLKKLNKKEPQPAYKKIEYDSLFGLGSSINTPIYKKPQQQVILKPNTTEQNLPVKNTYKTEDQYKKIHPPIYLNDKNDSRINYYTEAGNQYLYRAKKPNQQVMYKPLPPEVAYNRGQDIQPINVTPRGITYLDSPQVQQTISLPEEKAQIAGYDSGAHSGWKNFYPNEVREFIKTNPEWASKVDTSSDKSIYDSIQNLNESFIPDPSSKKRKPKEVWDEYSKDALQTKMRGSNRKMEDGGWLSKYDIPKAQTGKDLDFKSLMNPGIKQDATKVVRQEVMSEAEAKKLKARKDAEELARRKQAIATSATAKKKPFSTKQLAEETGAIADKLRLFPNDPDSFIDEYVNPGVMVGNMASRLGRVPLDVQEGNYGQAALSVLTPLATGALAGIGAKSTGQFANNLFNPLAGIENLPKSIGQKINTKNISKNLEDLTHAKDWAKQYGYELPENLERIAQSDELTNRTVRGMMDRHNTFVRGVSTNWDELATRNPEILRHLEGKGIDWQNNPKAAAEYMATHVPIQTGYGRASLNQDVFKKGMDAIYTSNSIPTAEGYTYGQGYITKVKKPTDFSSLDRKDWITQNSPKYNEEFLPDDIYSNAAIEHNKNILKDIEESKSYDDGWMQMKKEGDKYFWRNKANYGNTDYWDDISEQNYNNTLNTKKEEVSRILNEAEKQKILKTDFLNKNANPFFKHNENVEKFIKDTNLENNSEFQQKFGESYLTKENLMLEGEMKHLSEQLDRTGGEAAEAIRDKLRALEQQKKDMYVKNTDSFLKNYSKNYEPWDENKYAHYLHLGTPGEQILQPIKSWEITPDIWKNKSRAHTNVYSKKLSAMEDGGWLNKYN